MSSISACQKFIHAISPTPASMMSSSEIHARPPNTTMSPYSLGEKVSHTRETTKRPSDSDTQYWRYDTSQKRQRQGENDSGRLCFKFTSTGSCSRGGKCHFRHDEEAREHYMRNVCFDFLNKGKCERGPDCKFGHSLAESGASFPQKERTQRSVEYLIFKYDVIMFIKSTLFSIYSFEGFSYLALMPQLIIDNLICVSVSFHQNLVVLVHASLAFT